MKTIKIDIKQEVLDLPQKESIFRYIVTDAGEIPLEDASVYAHSVPVTEKIYKLFEVIHPLLEPRRYIVNIDDKDLFNDLLHITKAQVEDIAYKGFTEGIKVGKEQEIQSIKKLSWWKRLLNKF